MIKKANCASPRKAVCLDVTAGALRGIRSVLARGMLLQGPKINAKIQNVRENSMSLKSQVDIGLWSNHIPPLRRSPTFDGLTMRHSSVEKRTSPHY